LSAKSAQSRISRQGSIQPALSFDTQKTRLPYASCMQDALRTVKAMGLKIWFQRDFGVGANSSAVNALIICNLHFKFAALAICGA
jgi:hypothetical protein